MNKNTLSNQIDSALIRAANSEQRLTFLCPHHRDWVYFHSQDALAHLDQIQIKGEILLEHRKWREALPFVGCAWETAEILLQLYSGEKTFLVNRLCCLTVLLNRCLDKNGHKAYAEQVCRQTQSVLTLALHQLDQSSGQHSYLMFCIEQLKHPERFQVYLSPLAGGGESNALH